MVSPNSYSLRTLELVRNLSAKEALLFEKLAKSRFDQFSGCFVINPDNHKFLEDTLGITFQDILVLREAGLLVPNDFLLIGFQTKTKAHNIFFEHGPMVVWAEIPANKKPKDFGIIGFTGPGYQLSRIISVEPKEDCIDKLADSIKSDDVKVKCGTIEARLKGQYKIRSQKELYHRLPNIIEGPHGGQKGLLHGYPFFSPILLRWFLDLLFVNKGLRSFEADC